MPQTIEAELIHAEKYRDEGENFMDSQTRLASGLADNKDHFRRLRNVFGHQDFMAAGRVQSAIGSPRNVTAYNCFVSDTIDDSMVDGDRSIMAMALKAAATMRKGGGIGYNFGTLRPRGAHIAKLHSSSSGPISMMGIFDATCRTISSSGHRRGAQMGVLPIWHPDIEEYIRAKHPPAEAQPIMDHLDSLDPEQDEEEWGRWFAALQTVMPLTGFNLSVGMTDDFMVALRDDHEEYPLRFQGKVHGYVNPKNLWELLMRSTWDYGCPGVLFLDTINRMNNLWYCETISATNPCGEQPLPPNGACLLGSYNLVRFVHTRSDGSRYFSMDHFRESIPDVVRGMDNVVDRTTYPLREQEIEAKNKRRMGLGYTGLANALEACGFPYGSPKFLQHQDEIQQVLNHDAYNASVDLAIEKGAFPLFEADKYGKGAFAETYLDSDTMARIRKHGIRNSHLTSIAPTGTISLSADNVSSGCEPVFAYSTQRVVRTKEGTQVVTLKDYGVRDFNHKGLRASNPDEVTIDQHLDVLKTAANGVDSAVSKTLNVPSSIDWEAFKDIYVRAWEYGAKGCTTFTDGGRKKGILKSDDNENESACTIDPETGRRECQ